MGLDMYLVKRTRNTNEKWHDVAYWRKSNQIRQWFVDTIGADFRDNTINPVTKENLEALVDTCKKVLADNKLAEKLLPTSEGFFFGSTDYGDWYFEDLKETIEKVEKVLAETDFDEEEIAYDEWY